MKRLIGCLLICTMITTVQANVLLPTNADFEGDTYNGDGGNLMPEEWDNYNNVLQGWGNPTVDADHENDGKNGYVVAKIDGTHETSGGYAVVFQRQTIPLSTLGIPVGTTVTYFADIKDLIEGGGGPGAILKFESYFDNGNLIEAVEVPVSVTSTDWKTYSVDFTIPAETASVKFVFGVSTGWAGPNDKPSSFAFDNIGIGVAGGTPALLPVPKIGAAVDPNGDRIISWTYPKGADSADVYFLGSTEELINPADALIQPENLIADDTDANSVGNLPLLADQYYYWAVDVNTGALGFIWDFQTLDAPISDIDAGDNQYLWFDVNETTKTFTLNGSYTDDGDSPVTIEWTNTTAPEDTDSSTTIVITNPDSLTTEVTVDNTGWYEFTLTVTDAVSSTSGTVNIGVYPDACEAAKADPNDIAATYPNGHGDIDGDCDTDEDDYALFMESYLKCMSPKLGCTVEE